MHERGQTEIFSVLLSIVVTVLVSVGIVYQLKARASRQLEFRKLQQMVAAESARAEAAAVEEYTSMLESNNFCAICQTPTKTRCSRCKAVHYCSSTCQVQHWNQGHKLKCRAPVISSIAKTCELKVDNDDTTCKGGSSRNIVMSIPNENATKNIFSKGFMQKSYKTDDYDSQCNGIAKTSAKMINKDGQQLVQNKVSDGLPNSALAVEGRLSNPRKILFSYDHFVKLFHWDMLRPPCGLINCGNSCFANVVLQCLTYTRPLSAYLLFGSHRQECQRNDWCFMCELQDHINRTFKSEDAFSPIRILSRLRHIGNHLGYGRQEDAHEFMRFAVDSMQSICLDEAGGEKVVDIRSQETTIIQYMFGGHLQSQVKCMQCHHESNRYENMMDLTVEIQGPVESLEGALTQFTACEWLDGDNKYKCDRCAAYVKARKRLTVHEAPNILTIALKRFQSGKFGKLNKRVSFPEVLDVSPYMSGKRDDPPLYRLYAVVVHVDMLNASFFGHYICYVKDMEGVWYKIDDSKVKEVDLEVVLSQNAYMLLYSRTSPRPGPVVEHVVVTSSSATMNACKTEKSSPNGKLSSSSETRPTPNETSATSLVDATVLAPSANIRDTTRAGVCAVSHHEPVRSKLLESSFVTERCTSLGRMDIDMFTDDCGSLASNSSTSEHDTDSSNNSSESIQSSLECDGNCNSLQPFEKVMGKSCKRRLDTRLLPLAAEKPLETDKMPVCTLANDHTSFSCTPLTSYNTNLVASSVSGDSLERGISNNDSSVTLSQKYHGSQNLFETQHNSNPPQNMQLCNGDTLGSAKRPHVESYANGADVLFSPSKASLKLRFMEIESDEPSPERVVYLNRDMARSDQCTPLPECRTDTRLEDEVLLASTLHSNCSMPDAMKEITTDNDVRVCQMPR